MKLLEIVATIAWPLLAAVSLFVFRDEFRKLLNRVSGAELFGQKIVGQAVDAGRFGNPVDLQVGQFDPEMTVALPFRTPAIPASIYFASHDLMLTYAGAVTAAKRATLIQSLSSSIAHFDALGFKGTGAFSKLTKMLARIEAMKDEEWNDEFRTYLAWELWKVARWVGAVYQQARSEPSQSNILTVG